MATNQWTQRVLKPGANRELNDLRDAARELARQGQNAPGKGRLIFQTVSEIALIGTAVISGVLASIHLWKALTRPQHETHHGNTPEPSGAGRSPPRHRVSHAGFPDANDNEGPHSRRVAAAGRRHAVDGYAEKQR